MMMMIIKKKMKKKLNMKDKELEQRIKYDIINDDIDELIY